MGRFCHLIYTLIYSNNAITINTTVNSIRKDVDCSEGGILLCKAHPTSSDLYPYSVEPQLPPLSRFYLGLFMPIVAVILAIVDSFTMYVSMSMSTSTGTENR
jgi:hypothetical protein